MNPLSSSMLHFLFFLLFSFSWVTSSAQTHKDFLQCLSHNYENSNSISKVIYTKHNSAYPSVLQSSIKNLRFNTTSTPKPLVIITPVKTYHIQAAIACSHKHGMQLRVRSGGHDYEGLSYVSSFPSVVIDLINFRSVHVDVANKTAWVQAGATLGEVYYSIANKSRTLAFPAGVCSTVGSGGHFSGGGHGLLMRKYGLAADNIIDAHVIGVNGRVLDRASMGEDLFWAIRGGGGNTFGIVIAWKIKLVPVPATVTILNVARTLQQNATMLVHQWQNAIHKFHEDLFFRIFITRVNSSHGRGSTIQAEFTTLFLGGVDKLIPLMQESFPQLGVVRKDCAEMSWIEAGLYYAGFSSNASIDVLLNRSIPGISFKGKSDYVQKPIPEVAFKGLWKSLFQLEVDTIQLQFTAYGGKMDEISESSLPFPHRAGTLYQIHYAVYLDNQDMKASQWRVKWLDRIYKYMTPFVTKNPRSAYINYRDLDIGVNNPGNTSHEQASIWGKKYFNNNFERLVQVKTKVDPTNFFRNEQSIPPRLS